MRLIEAYRTVTLAAVIAVLAGCAASMDARRVAPTAGAYGASFDAPAPSPESPAPAVPTADVLALAERSGASPGAGDAGRLERRAGLASEELAGAVEPVGDPEPLLAEAAPRPDEPAGAGGGEGDAGDEPAGESRADVPTHQGPLLIYEAQVNLAVHEVRERISRVVEISDELDGFLQSQDDTSVIIRVPAARFREALRRVEALGDLLHRRVSAQDVSDQYRDVRIRLRNAIEMRDRLAELLARAETVPDSLTIERELERLTQTIEQLRGTLQNLQDRIAYSTITVRFQPVQTDSQVPRETFRLPFPWLDELGLVNLLRL